MGPDGEDAPVGTLGELMGFSAPMQRVYAAIHKVAAYSYPVALRGERGTGKESAARSIHTLGPRRNAPFVSFDCSGLAPTLLEAELFGYAKGAFAGAPETKWGLLALAGDGTLFLEEVAALPLNVQAKLLRVLEDGTFRPVGSTTPLPFRARIITASRGDHKAPVGQRKLMEDLYLRLGVMQIELPPLRERKSDIPLLTDFFIEKHAGARAPMEFSVAAMSYLLAYGWPGNVRELEHVVKQCVSATEGPIAGVEELNFILGSKLGKDAAGGAAQVDEQERTALVRALRETQGDQDAAASRLGIGKAMLSRRLKYYGLGTAGS
jgi:DNA-binding NtrC family response regulator